MCKKVPNPDSGTERTQQTSGDETSCQSKQAKAKPNPRGKGKKSDTTRATTFAQKSKEATLKQSQQQTNKTERRNSFTKAHQKTNRSLKQRRARYNHHPQYEHSTSVKLPRDKHSKLQHPQMLMTS